jgi:hypothetical protein
MSSLQSSSTSASQRPSNAGAFEFQRPTAPVYDLSSVQPTDQTQDAEAVRIVIDLRLPLARQLLEEDVRELGPVDEAELNEVRSRWLG